MMESDLVAHLLGGVAIRKDTLGLHLHISIEFQYQTLNAYILSWRLVAMNPEAPIGSSTVRSIPRD